VEHGELPDLDKDIEELDRRLDATKDPAARRELEKELQEMKEQRDMLRARVNPPLASEDQLAMDAQEAAVEIHSDIP
jgi:hypothetical protein